MTSPKCQESSVDPALRAANIRIESDSMHQESLTGDAHILLVDDEEIICNVAGQMLKNLGYTVSMCSNGKEVVEFYGSTGR